MEKVEQPSRVRLAELSSTLGAGILGVGVGVLVAPWLRGIGFAFVIIGLVLHAWGMFDKHRLERGDARPWWSTVLYWSCWLALAALGGTIAIRLLR